MGTLKDEWGISDLGEMIENFRIKCVETFKDSPERAVLPEDMYNVLADVYNILHALRKKVEP